MPSDQQIVDAQATVVNVFRGIRPELLRVFGTISFNQKDDSSPVTEWDVRVEETLRAALAEAFPNWGFEGEETGQFGSRKTYWLVDPIDGTSSFIRGLGYATNMAALVHDGHVVAAVIYDFAHDHVYTAQKGKGAYKDGAPIRINPHRPAGDLVLYSLTRQTFPQIREALHELGMRTLLPMGAAGHAYVMLAEGKIDGVIVLRTRTGAYDNAPGLLIAEEAGAIVLSYDEKTGVERHEFIIGSPLVVDLIERSGLI